MSRLIQRETIEKCLDHIAPRMPSADGQGVAAPVRGLAVAIFRSDQSCGRTGIWLAPSARRSDRYVATPRARASPTAALPGGC